MSKGKNIFSLQVWGEVSFAQTSKERSVITPNIFLYSIKEYFDFPLIIKVMGHWVTDYYMLWLQWRKFLLE